MKRYLFIKYFSPFNFLLMESKNNLPPFQLLNLSRLSKKQSNLHHSNLYNTCYLNAVIQCLFHLEKFICTILNCSGGELLDATKKLINKIKENKINKLSVLEIKNAMINFNDEYCGIDFGNSKKFLLDYLNGLCQETLIQDHNKLNTIKNNILDTNYFNFLKKFYKKGHSSISDLFCGVFKTENYCKKCNKIRSFTYHSFKIIDLPLYNLAKNNIYISLDIVCLFNEFFCEKEILNLFCETCNKKYYTKTNIYSFPKYLIIYLERKVDNYYIKNDIFNYEVLKFTNNKNFKKIENFEYNLKGIIYYSYFSKNIGHYSASCSINDEWCYIDDNEFYFLSDCRSRYKEDNPIILFYEKK